MNWFFELISNVFLLTALSAWFVAQLIKTIINAAVNRTLDWERMVGDGGMPSGHSATVSSLAIITALRCGTGSYAFAISAVLAIIVCHDAAGVRRETGKQAVLINEIIKSFSDPAKKQLPKIELKELVGHTPLQVLAGVLLGIAMAFLMHYVVFA